MQVDKTMQGIGRDRALSKRRAILRRPRFYPAVTLIEMLVVIAIISILVSMLITVGGRIDNSTKEQGVHQLFEQLEVALQEYHDVMNRFPDANDINPAVNSETLYDELHGVPGSRKVLAEISSNMIANNFVSPRVSPEIYDPWGTVLDYTYNSSVDTFPKLFSAGPNKTFDNGLDDIRNW